MISYLVDHRSKRDTSPKHGNTKAPKHGNNKAWKHQSTEAWKHQSIKYQSLRERGIEEDQNRYHQKHTSPKAYIIRVKETNQIIAAPKHQNKETKP